MHPFERILSVSKEDIEFELRGVPEITWTDFLLNPRKLRGSDFLMRWSQGVWSEKRLIDAINNTNQFYAIAYGLGRKLGLSKSAVLPTVIIKEEDRIPLKGWQELNNKTIHVWYVFFDRAYGLLMKRSVL